MATPQPQKTGRKTAKSISLVSAKLNNLDSRVINDYDPRLPLDVALGVRPLDEIASHYEMTTDELKALMKVSTFRRDVERLQQEAIQNGTVFKMKAQIMAEMYLPELHEIITNPNTDKAVKRGCIGDVVQWAGWSNKYTASEGNAPVINLNINI